jgi:hypothetical protein
MSLSIRVLTAADWTTGESRFDARREQTADSPLTFRHRASSIYDRRFATLKITLFIYLLNKYISLSDLCLTVHH